MTTNTQATKSSFILDPNKIYSMDEAKRYGGANPGMRFQNPQGSIGTVLARKSPEGKLIAEMTCIDDGPNHERLVSDWHQCPRSPDMAKKAKRKSRKGSKKVVAAPAAGTIVVEDAPSANEVLQTPDEVRAELQRKLNEARKAAGLDVEELQTTEATASEQGEAGNDLTDDLGEATAEAV